MVAGSRRRDPLYCASPDCPEEAEHGPWCPGHRKRNQRGQSVVTALRERYASAWERLTEAAIRYADADAGDDGEFRRAKQVLAAAALAYARSGERE